MSGHSKWSTIKRKKGALDAARGKIFTKIIKEITIAARLGGGDEAANPRLRSAILKAKASNMPANNVERAIAKGTGTLEGVTYEEITYEGYGPCGVAIVVETMTDNKNRTVAEVRHAFSKNGGNLGTSGSVAYLFEKKGSIVLPAGSDEEQALDVALEAGADDMQAQDDGSLEVITTPESFGAVKDALEKAGLSIDSSEVAMVASTEAEMDLETAQTLLKLVDHLEDLDDVQNVYSNASISDEVMSQL